MRNIPNKPATDAKPDPQSAVPSMPGGATGVPVEVPRDDLSTASALPERKAARDIPEGAIPKTRYFRVINGGNVMYNSCRTAIRSGKILSDATFDLALLRRQGIRLEEVEAGTLEPLTAKTG